MPRSFVLSPNHEGVQTVSSIRAGIFRGWVAVAVLLLHACGGSDSGTTPTPTPTIAASVSPTSASVQQGQTTSFQVTAVRTDYTGAINVTVSGLPTGVTVAPVSLPAGQTTTTVTVSASLSAAVGTHSLTVTASGTGVASVTGTFELTVTAAPRVTLSLETANGEIEQGEQRSLGVTIGREGGFDGAVTIALEGLPSGVTASSPTIAAGATSAQVLLTAASDAPLGTSTVTVRASGSGVADATASLSLQVLQGDAITLAATPAALSVEQGQSGTTTVAITRLGGFGGAVDFAATGAPDGVTVGFDPASATGESTTATIGVAASVAPGTYTITLTGSNSTIASASTTVELTVTQAATPTIAVSMSPSSLTVQGGQNGESTATITRAGGFAGNVALAVTGAPTGVTAAFAVTPVSGETSTLAIAVAPTTAPGTYTLTVTATGDGVADATATVTLTVTAPPSIGITLASGALSVEQAQSGTVGVTIDRAGGFTGDVDVAVTGAPAGVTATVTEGAPSGGAGGPLAVPITGTAATITVAATNSAAAGSYTLLVTATASGVTTVTASLTVTVTQAPVTGDSFTWSFCPTAPSWFAVKNEGRDWEQVTSGTGDFTFTVSGTTVGLAFVIVSDGKPTTYLRFAHKDELNDLGSAFCNGPKSLTGNAVGITGTSTGYISVGGSTAVVTAAANGNFSVSNVRSGPIDIFASRTAITLNGTTVTLAPDRLFMQRGIEPANGSSVSVDFTGANSFAPQAQDLGASNLGEPALLTMVYRTTGTTGVLFTETGYTSGPFWTYYGVPSAQQADGDFHLATLTTQPSNGVTGSYRSASVYFRTIQDQNVTFGPALGTTNFTTSTTSPYLRPRVQYTRQSQYNRYWYISYQQGDRTVQTYITDGYQGSSDIDFTVPDFSGVAGWMNTWGLQTSGEITFGFVTSGWDQEGALGPQQLAEGLGIMTATRTGTINP